MLPPGMKVVGDYYIPTVAEDDRPKRGYTTRAKEEARRTEVKFTGLVRRWEKRWVIMGHLRVLRWERVQDAAEGGEADRSRGITPTPASMAMGSDEQARKRARVS